MASCCTKRLIVIWVSGNVIILIIGWPYINSRSSSPWWIQCQGWSIRSEKRIVSIQSNIFKLYLFMLRTWSKPNIWIFLNSLIPHKLIFLVLRLTEHWLLLANFLFCVCQDFTRLILVHFVSFYSSCTYFLVKKVRCLTNISHVPQTLWLRI